MKMPASLEVDGDDDGSAKKIFREKHRKSWIITDGIRCDVIRVKTNVNIDDDEAIYEVECECINDTLIFNHDIEHIFLFLVHSVKKLFSASLT